MLLIPHPSSLIPSHPSSLLIPHPSSLIPSRKGFTLIEMLVVIGIIALLVAVLLGTFAGSAESARAARCLSNMKSLANAVQSRNMAWGSYPRAASIEFSRPDVSRGIGNAKMKYNEDVGWISWYSKGLYPSDSSQESSCRTIGLYSDVLEDYEYALSHGSLHKYVGGNSSVYVCPVHKDSAANVHWSYFMNPDYTDNIKKSDRVLLFGEIPFRNGSPGEWFPSGNAGNTETDAVIQYENENIGCNHKSSKFWVAHVVFADGHTEKLRVTSGKGENMSGADLRQLTEWLCQGKDVSFNGKNYEKLTQ